MQLISNIKYIIIEQIDDKEGYDAKDVNNDAYQKINYNNLVCIKIQVYTLYFIIKLFRLKKKI